MPDLMDNRSPFLVGISGCIDPVGYTSTTPLASLPDLHQAFDGILEWIFWSPCPWERNGILDNAQRRFVPEKRPQPNARDAHGRLIDYQDCWQALALQATPVVLLSALKPGIDTLFVEAVLDFKERHPRRPVHVRWVMPYGTPKEYLDCGLFDTSGKSRLQNLVERLRAQPGWQEDRDCIPVTLDNDWKTGSEQVILLDQIAFERPTARRSIPSLQQQLRLRASGEYIASFSDLLVAVYDHPLEKDTSNPNDLFNASTHSIVEAKRRGLAWELIAVTNNFMWADNGPVLRMGVVSQARNSAESSKPIPLPDAKLTFLHPYDAKPNEVARPEEDDKAKDDSDPNWQAHGDSIFRRILSLQEEFNRLPVSAKEQREIYCMLLPKELPDKKTNKTAKKTPEQKSPSELKNDLLNHMAPEGVAFAESLGRAAEVRRRAGSISSDLTKNRQRIMRWLVCLIGGAAVFLGMFEHWHSQGHAMHMQQHSLHPHEPASESVDYKTLDRLLRMVWLSLSLGCIALAGGIYYEYKRSRKEEKRFDYRALSEALRIQIYWALAGLNRSVAADYLQRQRDELDWIRYAVCGMVFPFQRWKTRFRELSPNTQLQLLKNISEVWVLEQEAYFEKNTKKLERKRHFWHLMSWSFATAGIVQIAFMLLHEFAEWSKLEGFPAWVWSVQVVIGIFGLWTFFQSFGIGQKSSEHEQQSNSGAKTGDDFTVWLVHRRQIIGCGLFISAMVGLLSHGFPPFAQIDPNLFDGVLINNMIWFLSRGFPVLSNIVPGEHDWWIILNGVVLLAGGLSLAWVERNFYTEEHRSFSSMRMLYHSANMRLESILKQMEELQRDHPKRAHDRERLLQEAQDILYNLGCEHLSENAEWLIYHRARPLEPFMAG